MKTLFILLAFVGLTTVAQAQQTGTPVVYEYMQFSVVESVVPAGLGRSRVITTTKDGQLLEKELKNFFSLTGINFQNILNNDRVIAERVNELAMEGWDLHQVTSGVYGVESSTGIFITRYIFRRAKK